MELPRKQPELSDALDQLDAKLYEECLGDIQKAFSLLTPTEMEFTEGEIQKCLQNPRYYLENYHFIRTKELQLIPLWPFWDSQEMFLDVFNRQFKLGGIIRIIVLKARQLGLCLDPSTRVLTADLHWIPISALSVGKEIVSVDDQPVGGHQARRMKTGVVEGVTEVRRMAYKISFDDGREVICTSQHPWLTKKSNTEA